MDLFRYAPWQLMLMFGIGAVFGSTLTLWIMFPALARLIEESVRRHMRVQRSTPAPVARQRMTVRPQQSEMPTIDLKPGLLPFDDRPTLVHEGPLPEDMVRTGPPQWKIAGEIKTDNDGSCDDVKTAAG